MHPNVYCSITHGGQDTETAKVSCDRWWDREDVYIHTMGHCSARRKDEILKFVTTQVDLEIMLSEISQAEKAKNHVISFLCET